MGGLMYLSTILGRECVMESWICIIERVTNALGVYTVGSSIPIPPRIRSVVSHSSRARSLRSASSLHLPSFAGGSRYAPRYNNGCARGVGEAAQKSGPSAPVAGEVNARYAIAL